MKVFKNYNLKNNHFVCIKKEIDELLHDPYELVKLGYGKIEISDKTKNEYVEFIHKSIKIYPNVSVKSFFKMYLNSYLIMRNKNV